MTPDDFRRIALGQPGAAEGAHMGHADFRLGGRIFATLGSPDAAHGMVSLAREEQEMLVAAEPAIFTPAKGGWGLKGSTLIRLAAADEATVTSAMAMAVARLAARRK
jgi:hypothetical protein